MENTSARGAPPEHLTTRQLADKLVELYWPHTVHYHAGSDSRVLRQNPGRRDSQAAIISYIRKFREREGADPSEPLARAWAQDPRASDSLVRRVEWKLIEMPLPRLQIIGGRQDTFLYTIGWAQGVWPPEVRTYQRRENSSFDNRILLRGDVGEHLVQLNGLLRHLDPQAVKFRWSGKV